MSNCRISGKAHSAAVGLLICSEHWSELSTWLREIEDETGDLDPVPSMQIRWDQAGGGLASHGSPARLDAIVASDARRGVVNLSPWSWNDDLAHDPTASAFAVLHRWAQQIRAERQIERPKLDRGLLLPRFVPAPLTVNTEARRIALHLDYAAAQPWVAQMHTGLRRLHGQLQATNGTGEPKPLGRCPLPTKEAEACDGPLRYEQDLPAYSSGGEPPTPGEAAVLCGRCGARWGTGREIALLTIELSRQEK